MHSYLFLDPLAQAHDRFHGHGRWPFIQSRRQKEFLVQTEVNHCDWFEMNWLVNSDVLILSRLRPISDSNLTRFDSFDSLNDKKAFEDSISSSEESILNYANDVIRLDDDNDDGDVDDNDDVFMAQLNRFTKQVDLKFSIIF